MIRVTEVLSVIKEPSYEDFRQSVGEAKFREIMSRKAREGTLLHRFLSDILMEGDISEKDKEDFPEYTIPVLVLRKWVSEHVEETISSERRYESISLGVSGGLDAIVRLSGVKGLCVLDLKCVQSITKKTPIQIAGGYTLVAKPLEFTQAVALQLRFDKKTSSWSLKQHVWKKKEFPRWQGLFLQALSLYKYMYADKKENGNAEEDI